MRQRTRKPAATPHMSESEGDVEFYDKPRGATYVRMYVKYRRLYLGRASFPVVGAFIGRSTTSPAMLGDVEPVRVDDDDDDDDVLSLSKEHGIRVSLSLSVAVVCGRSWMS